MPTHQINTVDDALRLSRRYRLDERLQTHGADGEGFASWLYHATRQLGTEELSTYLDRYRAEREQSGDTCGFDRRVAYEADFAMRGYRDYESRAWSLRRLILETKATHAGRGTWQLVADLATSPERVEVVHECTAARLVDLLNLLNALGELRLSWELGRYAPGHDKTTDELIRIDIGRLDETLSTESRWKDEEHLLMPIEVSALAHLVADGAVREAVSGKLTQGKAE